jgi:hypothetical protein
MTILSDLPRDEYARIFGAQGQRGTGRARLCGHCGAWHKIGEIPHNCRDEAPPRSHLAAPMIAPKFEPFQTGALEDPVIINDRRDKRNHMDRNDLVEFDEGVKPPPPPTQREWMEGFVKDFQRAEQEDPLNRPPVERIGETDTNEAGEIDTTGMEIAK